MKSFYRQIRTIESAIPGTMCMDRPKIYRELSRIKKAANGSIADNELTDRLDRLNQTVTASRSRAERRKQRLPHPSFSKDLPITLRKDDIIDHIICHPVVIVTGETGSGKTTQIPKFCLAAGRGVHGKIGCTQPRRIAAITIAERIADELGEPPGQSVGYKIRFQDKVRHDTYIKIMTDGILLAESQQNRFLNEYDTLVIDEAHERSLNIDFCIGILKVLLVKRRDLKLIVTSATIDTEKFSRAFNDAPIVEVSGRMYPVSVTYMPLDSDNQKENNGPEEDVSHIDRAVEALETLFHRPTRGDVLIFMPTEQDIRETCAMIEGRRFKNTLVMPLFARLPAKEQSGVFAASKNRKIVVATNIAETSITIPGIKYVIDTGLARISRYSPRSRATSLPVVPISKSSADQRKGRCGRVENGLCIRLFAEDDFESRPVYTPPEILRANLADVVLRMVSLKLGDVADFPFIDPPSLRHVKDGYDMLLELNAIEASRGRQPYVLTPKGRVMAKIPLDPGLAAMLIEADRLGCVEEVAIITSVLSIRDPRERPPGKEAEADNAHEEFQDPASDFITLLNIWGAYHKLLGEPGRNAKIKAFCKEKYMSFRRMREWRDIHKQVSAVLAEHGMDRNRRMKKKKKPSKTDAFPPLYTAIHQALLSGYLSNIAVKKEKNTFQAAKGREVMIFPGSTLFNRPGNWIVAAEMIETSKLFARIAANIDNAWIEEPARFLCRKTWLHPRWERNRGEVVADEQVSLFGLIIVPKRPVAFGAIDPEKASDIFIRKALVEGDMKTPLAFMRHNLGQIDAVKDMEDKIRKRDILVSEDDLYWFYHDRLKGVYDLASLKKVIKKKGSDDFLKMTEKDLLAYRPDTDELSLFPDALPLGDHYFECEYRFNPGQNDDGITVKIPAHKAGSVPANKLGWVVPGLFHEKVTAMIKGLPKELRKQLVPVNATADIIIREMPRNKNKPFTQALANFIHERFHVHIPRNAWPEDLPGHLKMRVAVTDDRGRTIVSGRGKQVLNRFRSRNVDFDAHRKARADWEQSGLTTWNFRDLPEHILFKDPDGDTVTLYPGLRNDGDTVSLRLHGNPRDASRHHLEGVRALFCIHLANDLKFLKKQMMLTGDLKQAAACLGGFKIIEKHLYDRVVRDLFSKDIRSSADFYSHAEASKTDILSIGRALLDQVSPVIAQMFETKQRLHRLKLKLGNNMETTRLLSVLNNDLMSLVPENFILLYERHRLAQLVRYIKGIGLRAERAVSNPEKDRAKAEKVQPYMDALRRQLDELTPDASGKRRRGIEDYFWMLEEYKVSVFAQEIKTAYPISPKKLDSQLKKISRMP